MNTSQCAPWSKIVAADMDTILAADLPGQRFAGKTVLISGANGMLPAYLVETFLAHNAQRQARVQVIALVRSAPRARRRFAHHADREELHFIEQPLSQALQIQGPVDFIFHGASPASPKLFGADPVGTIEPNTVGTHHLLQLARGKRSESFVYMSSGEVYGRVEDACVPTAETQYGYLDLEEPRTCYAEAKRLGEALCVAYAQQYGVPTHSVRPFHTYGPGLRLDDGRVFADFLADILANRPLQMHSDGQARRAYCYLSDATTGFLTVALLGKAGEAYNVGNEQAEVSVRQLAELLQGLSPHRGQQLTYRARAESSTYLPSPIPRNCPDTAKLRKLGWAPQVGLKQGMQRLLDHLSGTQHVPVKPPHQQARA
jgi:UDP-glucuronate decarboxylase